MGDTIKALKALYVALGGDADDVADIVYIPDMINAIATVAGTLQSTVSGIEGLPAVTTTENGKIMKVVEGKWELAADATA